MTRPSHRGGGRALRRDLDREQREAVSAPPGAVLVIAGAGSGKTRVLIRRAAWAVREWGLEPGAVVCVTFTNRAREEMEARLRALVGPRACEVVVGTFHAICQRCRGSRGRA
jgi:DNA helicase-2/ATP-dependent DNA helicase PcrA